MTRGARLPPASKAARPRRGSRSERPIRAFEAPGSAGGSSGPATDPACPRCSSPAFPRCTRGTTAAAHGPAAVSTGASTRSARPDRTGTREGTGRGRRPAASHPRTPPSASAVRCCGRSEPAHRPRRQRHSDRGRRLARRRPCSGRSPKARELPVTPSPAVPRWEVTRPTVPAQPRTAAGSHDASLRRRHRTVANRSRFPPPWAMGSS